MSAVVHRASGVALSGRGLLIEGPPGSGKSTLVLALLDRGALLIGDDGVTLSQRAGRLWASPPPNISGKLEIRNVGLVDLPATEAPLALVIRLDTEAPRFVETAETIRLAGSTLPMIRLHPSSPVLALRAEWAMRLHGLP